MKKSLVLFAVMALTLAACSGGAPKGVEISEVVFAKGLSENMEPVDPTTTFYPEETVYVSVRVPGRPKAGLLGAKFMYGDQLVAETSIDFSQENSSLLFSVGQDTFVGFNLTPDNALPISPLYTVELMLDGKSLGSYSYTVVPPPDAIPTVVEETIFAAGISDALEPVDARDVFSPSETVFFIGAGDLGRLSFLQADWYADGKDLIGDCTASVVLDRNLPNDRFYFSCEIQNGWPAGVHSVVLTVDDVVVTEATFSVQ